MEGLESLKGSSYITIFSRWNQTTLRQYNFRYLKPCDFLSGNFSAVDNVCETDFVRRSDCQLWQHSGTDQFWHSPNVPFWRHSHSHDLKSVQFKQIYELQFAYFENVNGRPSKLNGIYKHYWTWSQKMFSFTIAFLIKTRESKLIVWFKDDIDVSTKWFHLWVFLTASVVAFPNSFGCCMDNNKRFPSNKEGTISSRGENIE